ncbi:MAG: ATP-binding protein [Dehalococcoidia bacterium]
MALFRSLRVRLTLWYVLLLALTLAVFSAGVYLALRESLYSNLDDSLGNRVAITSGLVTDGGQLNVDNLDIPGDPEGEEFARIFDASGDVVFDNSADPFSPPVKPNAVADALGGRTNTRHAAVGDVNLEIKVAPLRSDGEIIGAAEVGLSDDDARDALASLLLIIAIAYPIGLIVTSAGGMFLASRALSPIDRVTRAARRISAEDLSQRLDLRLPDDEVGRLASTFDDMIARLDEAFRRQRQFTADASHELRTPLTAIKGTSEVALQRDRDPEEYREALTVVNAQVDRMIRLVASLLTLARADARSIPITRDPLDVARLVTDAADQIRPAAGAKGVTVKVAPGESMRMTADQDLLLQLLLNLLDNAVKYTPSGGSVEASWRGAGSQAEIAIKDTGPGIAAEHIPHIFDRFYRADKARARADGGAGLGLSISRWIAEAHRGTITVTSDPTGSTFTVRIPLA